jgi:plastocyanin
MKRSGTCIAAGAALSLVLVGATAASHAAAGSHHMDDAAMPQRSTIAYAIVKSIVARNIAALGNMVLASNNPATPENVIRIANFTFAPPTLTVHVGSSVTWKNQDDIVHVVKEKDGAFASDALDTDGTFSHLFGQVGIVDYFCAIHPQMTGKIVVEP